MSATAAADDSTGLERFGRTEQLDDGDSSANGETELVSRLRVIEEQPLSMRAAAYAGVHEELAKRLESAPADERA